VLEGAKVESNDTDVGNGYTRYDFSSAVLVTDKLRDFLNHRDQYN